MATLVRLSAARRRLGLLSSSLQMPPPPPPQQQQQQLHSGVRFYASRSIASARRPYIKTLESSPFLPELQMRKAARIRQLTDQMHRNKRNMQKHGSKRVRPSAAKKFVENLFPQPGHFAFVNTEKIKYSFQEEDTSRPLPMRDDDHKKSSFTPLSLKKGSCYDLLYKATGELPPVHGCINFTVSPKTSFMDIVVELRKYGPIAGLSFSSGNSNKKNAKFTDKKFAQVEFDIDESAVLALNAIKGKKMFGLEAVEASYVNGFFSSLRGKFYVLMYAVNKGFNAFNRTVVDGYAQPNELWHRRDYRMPYHFTSFQHLELFHFYLKHPQYSLRRIAYVYRCSVVEVAAAIRLGGLYAQSIADGLVTPTNYVRLMEKITGIVDYHYELDPIRLKELGLNPKQFTRADKVNHMAAIVRDYAVYVKEKKLQKELLDVSMDAPPPTPLETARQAVELEHINKDGGYPFEHKLWTPTQDPKEKNIWLQQVKDHFARTGKQQLLRNKSELYSHNQLHETKELSPKEKDQLRTITLEVNEDFGKAMERQQHIDRKEKALKQGGVIVGKDDYTGNPRFDFVFTEYSKKRKDTKIVIRHKDGTLRKLTDYQVNVDMRPMSIRSWLTKNKQTGRK